jgi:hypothetical protein
MVDYDALLITHQDNVAGRPRDPKKLIEFLPGSDGQSLRFLPVVFQSFGGQDRRRILRGGIDSKIDRRPLPGRGYRVLRARAVAFNDTLDSIKMLVYTVSAHCRMDFDQPSHTTYGAPTGADLVILAEIAMNRTESAMAQVTGALPRPHYCAISFRQPQICPSVRLMRSSKGLAVTAALARVSGPPGRGLSTPWSKRHAPWPRWCGSDGSRPRRMR